MTTVHHSPPPGAAPFAMYDDSEDQEPPSPSEVCEGDVSFISEASIPGVDEVIPSIEPEHEPTEESQPYSSSYTSRPSILSNSQSRRISAVTTTSFVSSLPSEVSIASKPILPANNVESRYSPRKERPPFRNPASVRAMQMNSPPPLPAAEASHHRLKGNYKLATPSRSGRSDSVSTSDTRRSRRRDSVQREHMAPDSPRPTPTPQQHFPLVLLHVTILPIQLPYAHDIMLKVMPEWLIENYRVLEERLQDIVLMRRGLLVPHPRDEYDVLEERILESLELKTPRLLKCGHFVGPDADTEAQQAEEEDMSSVIDDRTGRGSRMSGGTITEEDGEWKDPEAEDAGVCMDCHREMKMPGKGVGVGMKRWDIKIFAANGLMRAGAWLAAWTEMERCDVEIAPWIPDDVRKALDRRSEEEHEAAKRKQDYAAELQRQIEEEALRQEKLEEETEALKQAGEAELQMRIATEATAIQKTMELAAAEKRRLEDALTEKIEEAKEMMRLEFEAQALAEANSVAERLHAMEEALKRTQERASDFSSSTLDPGSNAHYERLRSSRRPRSASLRPRVDDLPVGTLLKNYFGLLLRDSRNLFIIVLTALVVYLSLNSNPALTLRPAASDLLVNAAIERLPGDISSVVVTSIATSVATYTVTEVQPAESFDASSLSAVPYIESSLGVAEVASQTMAAASSKTSFLASRLVKQATETSDLSSMFTSEPTSTPSEAADSLLEILAASAAPQTKIKPISAHEDGLPLLSKKVWEHNAGKEDHTIRDGVDTHEKQEL